MAYHFSSNRLFISGNFTSVSSTARSKIAAIDLNSNLLHSWYPPGGATTIATAMDFAGDELFIGTTSTISIGGVSRGRACSVDAITATVSAWDPAPSAGVNSICVQGSNLYLGGTFTVFDSSTRNRVASINTSTKTR
jgi:hypothetical protein